MNFITGVLNETLLLFIEMTPYILFGVIIAGILSVYVNKKYVAKHIGGIRFRLFSKLLFSEFLYRFVHAVLFPQQYI